MERQAEPEVTSRIVHAVGIGDTDKFTAITKSHTMRARRIGTAVLNVISVSVIQKICGDMLTQYTVSGLTSVTIAIRYTNAETTWTGT